MRDFAPLVASREGHACDDSRPHEALTIQLALSLGLGLQPLAPHHCGPSIRVSARCRSCPSGSTARPRPQYP